MRRTDCSIDTRPGSRSVEWTEAQYAHNGRFGFAPLLWLPGGRPGSWLRNMAQWCNLYGATIRKCSIQTMAIESRYRFFGDLRTSRYSRLYWLDIDVMLQDLFFRQLAEQDKIIRLRQSSMPEYCVLEGVGAVANALTVGRDGVDFDRFLVYISGYDGDENNSLSYDLRYSSKMIWINTNDRSPRLDIFIPKNISRHLTELYVTKRIDNVKLSVQMAVTGNHVEDDSQPEGFPLLSEAERLYFRRVQCELLSVYTSIGKSAVD
jgi:hypothetical protein